MYASIMKIITQTTLRHFWRVNLILLYPLAKLYNLFYVQSFPLHIYIPYSFKI